MSEWTHAICEACWIARRAHYDKDGVPVHIDRPVLLIEPDIEQCCFCGSATIVGIYVRHDPRGMLCHHEEAT